jgi:SAM-dependent methyltransferase
LLRPLLVQADADRPWPVRDQAATLVFASRVVHLLDARHVAQEAARVSRPGGYLLVGRVVRDPTSPRERLRREKQRRLAERGLEPRRGEAGTRRLLEACLADGAEALAPRVVATWASRVSAERILSAWAALPGMGGARIAPALQMAILDELWAWARRELGDPRWAAPCDERYVLEGVRFGRAGDPRRPTTMNNACTMIC